MRARELRKAPEPGAVRIHRLAPATEDAWAWVRDKMADQGWRVLEADYRVEGGETQYAMVSAWAIPPSRIMEEEGGTA
jgi:hypothetical protein